MLLLSLYIAFLLGLAATAPKKPNKDNTVKINKDALVPKTVCRVGRSVYQPGDTWSEQMDACVRYKCLDSGFVQTNKTGCMYKGICKDFNFGPWTENCFTFECVQGDSTSSFYRLTSAGCKRANGRCLQIGRREVVGCDVVECQIEGSSVVSKRIKTGCSTKTGCKDLGQYWHDGCTVYTCALEKDRAIVRSLPHDRMRWPGGQYALLRPQSGCPDDNVDFWASGLRKHYGEGRNYFSSSLSLSGIYAQEFSTHEFCVRQLKTERSPGYMTDWGPGNYCVFRSRGSCPAGFTEGFLMLDDSDRMGSHFQRGALPDGDYGPNTGFFFCCRNDGPVADGIELPTENPFVLFMNSKTGCQSVTGMKATVQTISFSGAAGPDYFQNGTVPYIQTDTADITLSLCYYQPTNECGCVDKSGEIIEANTEKKIDCVVKRCTSVDGKKVVDILEGGCKLDNSSCIPEGHPWSVFNHRTCTRMNCVRITTGSDITFETRSLGEGCSEGTNCFAVGGEKTDNCYSSRCELDKDSKIPSFKPFKAACPWHGACKSANSTWVDRCTTYLCNVTSHTSGQFRRHVVPVEYGCDDGKGKCYKIGDNVTDNCYDAVCRMSENKTVIYLDVIKRGCRWRDGCKKVHETWSHGCHDYRCEWINTDGGFSSVVNATNVSCQWNGMCYKQDEVWSDGCVDYKCAVTRHHNKVSWKVETHQLACTDFSGKCVKVGHNITENCVTYRCNYWTNMVGMELVSAGCPFADRCIEENEIYSDDTKCMDYICQKLARPGGAVMQLSVSQYKCSFNNTCIPENDTWKDGCRTRKCAIFKTDKSVQRSTAPVKAGCDDEGICRPVGYTKVTNSCTQYECEFKREYRDAFFTLVGGGCKSSDGQCHQVNTTWEEVTSDVCVTYRCIKKGTVHVGDVASQMCRDAKRKCQKIGNTGFPSIVNGKREKNCACRASDAPIPGVRIQCSG